MIPNPTLPPHPALAFAASLAGTLASLLIHVAASFRPLGAFTLPVWTRISRARQRLARLLARIAEGRFPPPRAHIPDAALRHHGPPAPYLPRRPGWLVHTAGFQIANHASQLATLLRDPQTQATLAALPPHALAALGRALRPLARLLGVDLSAELLRPPPAPKPARPRPVRPPPPPPLNLPRYILAAARAWKKHPA